MTQTQWKILPFSVLEQYCFVCVAAGRHAYSAYNSKLCRLCELAIELDKVILANLKEKSQHMVLLVDGIFVSDIWPTIS